MSFQFGSKTAIELATRMNRERVLLGLERKALLRDLKRSPLVACRVPMNGTH